MPTYKQDMTATSGNMGGDKKKKRKAKKAYATSVSGGPDVVRKETDASFKPNTDDNENKGRGGKGPKPMSRTRRAKASVMKLKDGLVSRFQGSTPTIGKNELMKPVIESLTPSVAGQSMLKATIKKPIAISYDAFNKAQQSADPMPKTSSQKKKVETKLTKGQKRSYELRDSHS